MWVWGAGLFCLGAWGLQQQARLPGLGWMLAWLAAALVYWSAREALGRLRHAAGALLCVAAGFLWAAAFAHTRLAGQLPAAWEGRDILVQGVVAEMPRVSDREARFRFDVESLSTPLAPALERIQLHWYNAPASLRAGERWRVTVRLKRPHGNVNPHGFDREYWSLERGLQAVGYVKDKAPAQRVATQAWGAAYLVERARQILRERIVRTAADASTAGVLVALAVGDQDAIARDQWRLFTRTGVGHLMSISGLHITMLSTLAALLTALAWRRSARLSAWMAARSAAVCAGMTVGAGYAALSGFGVPAQRTVLMLAVGASALLSGRQWSAPAMLATALWAVLLADPFAVMAPGFWLSFSAVALILYVSLGRLRAPSAWWQWTRTQGALSLGLVPLSLLLFQQVSVVSPFANAFAIPLVSLVVVPLTLLGMLLPVDGVLNLAEWVMECCLWLLRALDSGDWVTWQQALPPAWTLALAVLGVLWCLAPRGLPARSVGLLALLPACVVLPPAPAAGEYWMDVLDVGQGLSVLLRTKHHSLLYDAGPSYGEDADAGERIVAPHLRAVGVTRLHGLVISHDDADHSGGAASVVAAAEPGWVASSLPADHALVRTVPRHLRCMAGQRWEWDGVRFEFLHPDAGAYPRAKTKDNDRSCVLHVRGPGGSVLLPGDIEAGVESRLVTDVSTALAADVLLAPHHGSATSSTAAFLRAVSPTTVIVTSGYRNRHGHPRAEVLARYAQVAAGVLRTDRDGAIRLRFGSAGVQAEAWRRIRPRYWHD